MNGCARGGRDGGGAADAAADGGRLHIFVAVRLALVLPQILPVVAHAIIVDAVFTRRGRVALMNVIVVDVHGEDIVVVVVASL